MQNIKTTVIFVHMYISNDLLVLSKYFKIPYHLQDVHIYTFRIIFKYLIPFLCSNVKFLIDIIKIANCIETQGRF